MMQLSRWALLLMTCCCFGQDSLPFAVRWTQGKCLGCKIAADLTDVRWLNRLEGWGVGMAVPPQGAFDYSLVHTVDAGKTWREIPNSWQHAAPPTFTFLDPAHGWYSCSNVYCGGILGSKLFRSSDGGRRWEEISEQGMVAMAFSDPLHGWGKSFWIDDKGDIVGTSDGGRRWSKIQILGLKKPDGVVFLSGSIGWVTDKEGDALLLFRTIDGGKSWEQSRLALPAEWTEVRQISFLDRDRGWVVLKHVGDDAIRLLATNDGGRSWSPVALPAARNSLWWQNVVTFVSDKVGLVFTTGDADKSRSGVQQFVLYTVDGGAQWARYPLDYSIYGCQAVQGDVVCSADRKMSHFGVLTLHPK